MIMNIKCKLLLASSLLLTLSTSIANDINSEINSEHLTLVRNTDKPDIQYQIVKSENSSQSILLYIQDSKCRSSAKQFFGLTNSLDDSIAKLYVAKIGENDIQKHHGQCSDTFLSNSSLDQRILDYQKVIENLRNTAPWWDKKLYIIGESEGGLIAGLIAANTPETSKLAILSFGGGMTMSEAWIAALTKSMQADGKNAADIDEMQANATQFFKDKIAKSNSKTELASNRTYKWWASVVDVRLSDTLAKIDFPIYIAHGTEDTKIPVESAQKVSDLFSILGKENLVYNEYTGTIKNVSKCHTKSATKPVFTDAVNWLVN